MKIEKTISYTLSINELEGHGIVYQASLDTDVAVLMMTLQLLENALNGLKTAKKLSKVSEEKADIGRRIYVMSKTIQSLNGLTMQLCDNYELLKASADLNEKKEAIKAINRETPPLTESQKDVITNL